MADQRKAIMEKKELDEKILEVSQTILSYCIAHTSNQYDAEDLAQEILLEIYKSSTNIRNDRAFYGFLWSVVGNVYKQWYRKRKRDSHYELIEELADDEDILNKLEMDSDIRRLRRELTLLVEKYRRAMILYYLENNSCSQIAKKLSISESMVKYLLFKSRQIIKDRMNMERKLGEQSYNPKTLNIGFWGGYNRYVHICDSKIAQNILFACYNDRLNSEQISLEIGVALPYMEDDLRKLTEYGLLEKDGNRYFTNIVIFTREFDKEANIKTLEFTKQIVEKIKKGLEEKESTIRKIGFYSAEMDKNTFTWQMSCILLRQTIMKKLQDRMVLHYPVNKFGEKCFVWGKEAYDDNERLSDFSYANCTVSNQKKDRIFFMDFGINGEFIHHLFFNRQDYTNVLLDLVNDEIKDFGKNDSIVLADLMKRGIVKKDKEKLYPNMPVFTTDQKERLLMVLDELSEEILVQTQKMIEEITRILQNHIPAHLKKTAKDMAYFRIQSDCISGVMEMLYREKYLLTAERDIMLPTTYIVLNK